MKDNEAVFNVAICPKCGSTFTLTKENVVCATSLKGDISYVATCGNRTCRHSFVVKLAENEHIRTKLTESQQTDWFALITERLRDFSEGCVWSDGCEILCKTESAADAMADLLESLYRSEEQDVLVNTGYYDPEEDEKAGECDRYTGWWYVNVD